MRRQAVVVFVVAKGKGAVYLEKAMAGRLVDLALRFYLDGV